MKILGVDPGLAHFGYCVMGSKTGRVLDCGVFVTKKSKKARSADDLVWRAQFQAGELGKIFDKHEIVVVVSESLTFPRQATAAAMLFGSLSIVLACCTQRKIKFRHVGRVDAALYAGIKTTEVVSGRTKRKKVEKEDVIAWAKKYAPNKFSAFKKGNLEHVADATLNAHAGLKLGLHQD